LHYICFIDKGLKCSDSIPGIIGKLKKAHIAGGAFELTTVEGKKKA